MSRFCIGLFGLILLFGCKAALAQRWEPLPDTVGRVQSPMSSQFFLWPTLDDYKVYKQLRQKYDEATAAFDDAQTKLDVSSAPDAFNENGNLTPDMFMMLQKQVKIWH